MAGPLDLGGSPDLGLVRAVSRDLDVSEVENGGNDPEEINLLSIPGEADDVESILETRETVRHKRSGSSGDASRNAETDREQLPLLEIVDSLDNLGRFVEILIVRRRPIEQQVLCEDERE